MTGRGFKGLSIIAAAVLAGSAAFGLGGDEKKWAEAMGTWQRLSGSKDPAERARAVEELGSATYDKKDKQCFGFVYTMIATELGRSKDPRDEEKISNEVLEACVGALKKITAADAIDEMVKKAKDKAQPPRLKLYIVWGLGGISNANAEKALVELAEGKDPSLQIAATDALVERNNKENLDLFLRLLKENHTWEVKVSALKGLEKINDPKCVEPLIDALEKSKADEGRFRFEINRVLAKFVGKDLNTADPAAWRAAWTAKNKGKDAGAGPGATQVEPTEFFGLKTKSTRIVFVLDRTGSMDAPLNYKEEPKKEPPKKGPEVSTGQEKKESPEEKAARDEAAAIKKKYDERPAKTRIEVLKKEFINTIWNLDSRVHFTVVWYEATQQPWKDFLVPATWANKLECIKETDKLKPSGGTNIWGALEYAYRLVQVPNRPDVVMQDKKGNYATIINGADTFFLMTDGAHNLGKFVKSGATSSSEACDTRAFLDELRKVNKLRKVIINTVCLGSEANGFDKPEPKMLQDIATETGGEFVHIKG